MSGSLNNIQNSTNCMITERSEPRPSGGERIRELRKAQGLTLEALARRVGTTNQQISHLEKGRRRLSEHWIARLAAALNCDPAEFLGLPPHAMTLSRQERMLVSAYRSLSEQQREALLCAITSLANPHKISRS